MDLALNNLQRLDAIKPNQPTNQPTNQLGSTKVLKNFWQTQIQWEKSGSVMADELVCNIVES